MNRILKYLFLSTLILTASPCSYADDNGDDNQTAVELNPRPAPIPTKPQAPSYIRLSATVDRGGVTIISNVDVMAQVQITGDTGAVYFDSFVALAPSCRCFVPATGDGLTIYVTIDDRLYIGYTNINK